MIDPESTGAPAAVARLEEALQLAVEARAALRNRVEDLQAVRDAYERGGATLRLAREFPARLRALYDALGVSGEFPAGFERRMGLATVLEAVADAVDHLTKLAGTAAGASRSRSSSSLAERLGAAEARARELTERLDAERMRTRELEAARQSLLAAFVEHVNVEIERTRRQNAEIDAAISRIYRSPFWGFKRVLARLRK